jgi:hypothetical protein
LRSYHHWSDRQKRCCIVSNETIAAVFASAESSGPQVLDTNLVELDGKHIQFQLIMEPLLTQCEITILCRLVADWDLPQPLYARLDLGDMHWIGPIDPDTHVAGWLAKRREVLDPRNPRYPRGPLKLRISTTEGTIDTNLSGSP